MEWFFDEELVALRWEWVSAVRARVGGGVRSSRRALSAEQIEAEHRAHAVATAYFQRIGELQAC
jgi:hypothetical protein